jgi:hypothetical protein
MHVAKMIAPHLSPVAETYARIKRLAALCETPSGLVVLLPTEPMKFPSGTTRVLWCPAVAARQIEIEVARGSSVEAAAQKFGIELIEYRSLSLRAKWRALCPK